MPRSAEQQYKDFTDSLHAQVSKLNIGRFPKKWILVGFIDEISYLSDKWFLDKKNRGYRHKLKKHGVLLKSPDGTKFLIVKVKVNMKRVGLTG